MTDDDDEQIPCDVCHTNEGVERYDFLAAGGMVFCAPCFVRFRYVNVCSPFMEVSDE